MSIDFLNDTIFTILLIVSVLTNLTVEGVKKLLHGTTINYSPNVLAAIFSVVITCAICVLHIISNEITFSLKVGIEIVILMYLGFLTSTIGYDKVIQTFKQIQNSKR